VAGCVLKNVAVVKKQATGIDQCRDRLPRESATASTLFFNGFETSAYNTSPGSANVTATVESDVGSEELAKSQERTYGRLLVAGQMFNTQGRREITRPQNKAEVKQIL